MFFIEVGAQIIARLIFLQMRHFDATVVMNCCDAHVSTYLTLPVLSLKGQCCSQSAEITQGGLHYLHPQCKT